MGKQQSKIERPQANVVNEIEIENNDSQSIKTLLLIITVILIINILLKIYSLHKRTLKKRYLNRAASIAQI